MHEKLNKQKLKAILAILIVLTISLTALADIEITDINFLSKETNTTVSWNTNTITNGTFSYGVNEAETSMNDWQTQNHHELTFPTQKGQVYYYEIKSCGITHQDCAEVNGTFKANPLFLTADVPQITRSTVITITGKTMPSSEVRLYVGNREKKRIRTASGSFVLTSIRLLPGENTIKIQAKSGQGDVMEKEFTTIVDLQAPKLSLSAPGVTTAQPITIKGAIDEDSTLALIVEAGGNKTTKEMNVTAGNLSLAVALQEGENTITVIATDKAGNKVKKSKKIIFDSGPPQFLETNLEALNPSYKRAVTIRGKLSEKASVTVFLNGKAEKTVLSDD
ncbi:hypothetical protein DRJ25_04050, partial [Candidatus Woesearchaeota archaeon]